MPSNFNRQNVIVSHHQIRRGNRFEKQVGWCISYLACMRSWVRAPAWHKAGVWWHTCYPTSREMQAGKPEAQDHAPLWSKLCVRWGYSGPVWEQKREQGKGEREGERTHRKMCYQTPCNPSIQVSQPGGWRVQGQPGWVWGQSITQRLSRRGGPGREQSTSPSGENFLNSCFFRVLLQPFRGHVLLGPQQFLQLLSFGPRCQQAIYPRATKFKVSEGSFLFGQARGQLPHGSGSQSTIPTLFWGDGGTGSYKVQVMTMQPRTSLRSPNLPASTS